MAKRHRAVGEGKGEGLCWKSLLRPVTIRYGTAPPRGHC